MRIPAIFAFLFLVAACGGGGGGGGTTNGGGGGNGGGNGGGGNGGGGGTEIVVTTLNDAGAGSLRQALADALDGYTITFEAGLTGTITLTSGGLLVDEDVTVDGPDAVGITVDGNDTYRVFDVPAGVTAVIRDLTVVNGAEGSGACIRNEGTLTLERVFIENGNAPGTTRGGGIQNMGTMTCREVIVRFCSAFNGAGIANDQGANLLLDSCTVSENTTTGNSGGGIVTESATLEIVNSTISGNSATGTDRSGGGIACLANDASSTLEISFSTIANNDATGNGGGIRLSAPDVGLTNTLRIKSSIVAENFAAAGIDVHASAATTVSSGYNVIGEGEESGLVDGVNGDQVGTAGSPVLALLAPLAPGGGFGDTHALLGGSVAIDAVAPGSCTDLGGATVTTDQRGDPRPKGASCDAGAFEL